MKFRKTAAMVMAGFIGLSSFAAPVTAYGESWEKDNGVYRMADGTEITKAIARGIDVSQWQQEIDWQQAASDDVSFVMLGTRYKGEADPRFHKNATEAASHGIKLGAYIYSYATSVEMAEAEADFILDLIKDYPISFPVAFDAEDAGTLGTLTPSQVSDVINAFCRKIEAAGYYPMVYANEYWIANKIDVSKMKYDVWIARYNVMHTYENPAMWQATSTGSINGISTNVDIDFLYKDFSSLIPSNTWRTIGGKTYYYQNYIMQKSAWIDDGTGWFYMDSEGSPSKGWLTLSDARYYLDNDTGRMVTGWKELEGKNYYFTGSGAMAAGWESIDGFWYYFGKEGTMETGWQNINGVLYYFHGSGAMAANENLEYNGEAYHADSSGSCIKMTEAEQGNDGGQESKEGQEVTESQSVSSDSESTPPLVVPPNTEGASEGNRGEENDGPGAGL